MILTKFVWQIVFGFSGRNEKRKDLNLIFYTVHEKVTVLIKALFHEK